MFSLSPLCWEFFIINQCQILSNAFSASINMIIWLLSFILFIWCVMFIDLQILNQPCIPGINPIWPWCMTSFFNPHPRICFLIREREREKKYQCERETICCPNSSQTHHLSVCPDQGLNLQHFGVWDSAPTNLATRPGQDLFNIFLNLVWYFIEYFFIYVHQRYRPIIFFFSSVFGFGIKVMQAL